MLMQGRLQSQRLTAASIQAAAAVSGCQHQAEDGPCSGSQEALSRKRLPKSVCVHARQVRSRPQLACQTPQEPSLHQIMLCCDDQRLSAAWSAMSCITT